MAQIRPLRCSTVNAGKGPSASRCGAMITCEVFNDAGLSLGAFCTHHGKRKLAQVARLREEAARRGAETPTWLSEQERGKLAAFGADLARDKEAL